MPVVVQAGVPKKSTKTPSCVMVFWSARIPTVPALFQDAKHSTCSIILENWRVARKPSIVIHHCVEGFVVQRPRHVAERKTINCVGEGRKFPRPDVPCEIDDAFTPALPSQKIFVTIQNHELLYVFFGVQRQAGEFGRHPAQIANHFALYFAALPSGPFGKRQGQIEFCCLAQLGQHQEQNASACAGQTAGHRPRQDPK